MTTLETTTRREHGVRGRPRALPIITRADEARFRRGAPGSHKQRRCRTPRTRPPRTISRPPRLGALARHATTQAKRACRIHAGPRWPTGPGGRRSRVSWSGHDTSWATGTRHVRR